MEVQTQNNNIITPYCTPSLQGVKPFTPLKLYVKELPFSQNLNVKIHGTCVCPWMVYTDTVGGFVCTEMD